MELNEEQRNAVLHKEGPCLLVAGPGSGKTRVITERLFYLTTECKVPENEILVVTFTKAAAREMEERFRNKCGGSSVLFGTFHSIFFKILSETYAYQKEDILDERKKELLRKEILSRVSREVGQSRSEEERDQLVEKRYAEEKRRRGKLDFEDILVMTEKLLRENEIVRRRWQSRYKQILVDEFQDINTVQYQCIRMLSAPRNNLFFVGDDDQSIYAFRNASPKIMKQFSKDYQDARILFLNTNYRCSKDIVKMANKLIQNNTHYFPKELRADIKESGVVKLSLFHNVDEEAERISEEIIRLTNRKFDEMEIAVLYRTMYGAESLVSKFREKNIPYLLQDRIQNAFKNPALDPVFSILNYLIGDRSTSNVLRFINVPYRGVLRLDLSPGETDLSELLLLYREKKEWGTVRKLEKLISDFSVLQMIERPYGMINYIRKGMGLELFLYGHKRSETQYKEALTILDFAMDHAKKYRNVEEWYQGVVEYTKDLDAGETASAHEKGKVVVMSIHRSKGLEFDAVFVPGLCEGVLPHEKSFGTKESVEEERRILYVAMTRAKKYLHLSTVEERFGKRMEISRFMHEIS